MMLGLMYCKKDICYSCHYFCHSITDQPIHIKCELRLIITKISTLIQKLNTREKKAIFETVDYPFWVSYTVKNTYEIFKKKKKFFLDTKDVFYVSTHIFT